MTNSYNTETIDLDSLISSTFTQVKDDVFQTLIECGIGGDTAFGIAYIDVPTATDSIRPLFDIDDNELASNHDDVFFADL